jgi:hypothetical protein
MIVVAMPVVHEHVHQRACCEDQPGQPGQDVGTMFGDEEKPSDQREPDQHDLETRSPGAAVV